MLSDSRGLRVRTRVVIDQSVDLRIRYLRGGRSSVLRVCLGLDVEYRVNRVSCLSREIERASRYR